MAGQKVGIKIPIQDPSSGRVYEILWTQPDKEPTKWDLLAELQKIKEQERWTAKANPLVSPPSLEDFEIGNKLYQKALEREAVPAFDWETREPSIGPEPQKSKLEQVLSTINPFYDNAMANLRKYNPERVINPQAYADRWKTPGAKLAGAFTGDLFSIPSMFFNTVGAVGAGRALTGAVNEAKAIRAAQAAAKTPKTFPGELTRILATAPRNSPEWKAAARKLFETMEIDMFPGVNVNPNKLSIKQLPTPPIKLTDLEKATIQDLTTRAKALKAAGKPDEAKELLAQARKYYSGLKEKTQLSLNLEGAVTDSAVGIGPDRKKYSPFTFKLQNPDFTQDILPFLKSWVDKRNSADMVREKVGRLFGSLREGGFNTVHAYQSGDRSGLLADIEKMLRQDWVDRVIVGDTSNFKPNYLSQYWENTPKEIREIFGLKNEPKTTPAGPIERRAGIRPSFTKKSTFPTYQAGIEASAGRLKPKYNNIVDILGAYMVSSNKYQADKSVMNFLRANKFIAPNGSAFARQNGYKVIEGLPGIKTKGGIVNWAARPDVADYMNNYFGNPHWLARFIGNWSKLSKGISMGAGIPWTMINAHGLNIGKRAWDMAGTRGLYDYLTTGLTMRGARKGYEQIFNDPKKLDTLLELSKRGYVGNIAEDFRNLGGKTGFEFGEELRKSKNPIKRALGKAEGFLSDVVEKPLFGYKLPATKAQRALARLDDLLAQGVPREQALRQVAEEANTYFGGMNYVRNYNPTTRNPFKSGGLDRTTNEGVSALVLAPDWAGSNLRLGKNVYKSLFGAADPMYARTAARNAFLRNAARIQATRELGEDVEQQKASEGLMFPIGTTAGDMRRRNFDPFGTATEWMRLPNQIMSDAQNQRFSPANKLLLNRLNPIFRNWGSIMWNEDYNENPLYGEDRWKRPIPFAKASGNVFKTAIAPFTHPILTNAIGYGLGSSGLEDSIIQSLELPLKYRYISQPKGRQSNPFSNPYETFNPYRGIF